MGILELHFHESDFNFAPSVGANDDDDILESNSEDGTMLEPDSDPDDGGAGALLALGVLVVLGVLVGLRRRRNGGSEEGGEYGEDEEISISA
ncbi:MYXO-CTERM sorting domain-containing protein [Halobacterium jilantaiense]|uniref:MYXO-CTERM domain-containing protein n=1 Tax=Halobacterium jilantaiense TaxID=355548 RepID=A0A1I0QQT7_9EURY|nr:MYXO-CTERM sorting domain-containing protein [Halobacterium jilantaiense]SEW29853.1 hypothetical protein SAMN04487945_2870 [Halobacterium jilantaiense]